MSLDFNSLTVSQIKKVADVLGLSPEDVIGARCSSKPAGAGAFVLVRTRNAGVHAGYLVGDAAEKLSLLDARRVWRWRGANSLSELSQKGAETDWTRISEPVPTITLTDAIEIIPCSDAAKENLKKSRWGA